jgi:hypothetical protein
VSRSDWVAELGRKNGKGFANPVTSAHKAIDDLADALAAVRAAGAGVAESHCSAARVGASV